MMRTCAVMSRSEILLESVGPMASLLGLAFNMSDAIAMSRPSHDGKSRCSRVSLRAQPNDN